MHLLSFQFLSRRPAAVRDLSRLILLSTILFAFAWRVDGLTRQSLWRDEVDAIYFALRALPDTLSMFVAMAQNGPLYFLSLRLWFYFAGAGEFALRYVSVVAGTLTIPLTWQVARRLLQVAPAAHPADPPKGDSTLSTDTQDHLILWRAPLLLLWPALLMAVNPYQLWYGQEGKMYTLITMLALVAHWLWLLGIQTGGWRIWLGYFVVVSCALYSHLLMIILIPLHMLWFLVAWPQSKLHWRGYGSALAGLTLPYLPLLAWQWPMLMASESKTGFTFVPFSAMAESLTMSHNNGLLPQAPWFQLLPMLFLAAVGILLGGGAIGRPFITADPSQRHPEAANDNSSTSDPAPPSHGAPILNLSAARRHGLLLIWLLFPILMIYVLSLRQPVFTDRYVIWIAPALMIIMTLGVRAIRLNAGALARPLLVLLLLYTLGYWGYTGWQEKTTTIKYDLRSGIQYVSARRDPTTLLILQIPHQQWAWQYYTSDFSFRLFEDGPQRLGNWAEGLWTNNGLPNDEAAAQVDEQMRTLAANATDLWLLSSEVEMWDSRHLMRAWLEIHGTLLEQADFHGVQARHYQLAPQP